MQKGKMISYRFLFDATNSFRLGFYMMQRAWFILPIKSHNNKNSIVRHATAWRLCRNDVYEVPAHGKHIKNTSFPGLTRESRKQKTLDACLRLAGMTEKRLRVSILF